MTTTLASPKPSRRWPLVVAAAVGLLALAAGGSYSYLRQRLRASLPQLDGERRLAGLAAAVRVERDAHGVPVVRGQSRVDVARATRLPARAGPLLPDGPAAPASGGASWPSSSARRCSGPTATSACSACARWRERAVQALPPDERALLDAYTEGVAAGLAALGAPPLEYLLLRSVPVPWKQEDSLLCALAMYITLQSNLPGLRGGARADARPAAAPAVRVPHPAGHRMGRARRGRAFRAAADPRPGRRSTCARPHRARPRSSRRPPRPTPWADADREMAYGSNNWAVAGAHTTHGGALLANDMHLGLRVPNIWYRASLVWPDATRRRAPGHRRDAARGAGVVVVGSNGQRRLGLHQQRGRLGRPGRARGRPDEPGRLPDARGPAALRARDRDDPRARARRTRRSRSWRRSGGR